MVNVRKRGKVYQYQFEIAKVDGKRKYISKSGFKTKNEALMTGIRDVADILGHSRIETTENYYISSSEKTRKEANNILEKVIQADVIYEVINY